MLQVFKNQGTDAEQPVILVVTRDASTVQAMEFQVSQDKQLPLRLVEQVRDDAVQALQGGQAPERDRC